MTWPARKKSSPTKTSALSDLNATGPLAWVTGSASGIGLALAERLHALGWRIHGLDLRPSANSPWPEARVDLSDATATQAFCAEALQHGLPDAVVHAAGLMHAAPVGELDWAHGQAMWALHVQAAQVLAQAVLPAMAARGSGRMVLLGSRVASGKAGRSQYAATKAALVALARSWAAEVVGRGVTVNVVSPAATDTPLLQASTRQASAPQVPPLGRLIAPAEVAATIGFLLSPDAAAITGQELVICGGASLNQ